MPWLRRILASILLLSVSSGCNRSDRSYYPLDEGRQWEYRLWGKVQSAERPEVFLAGQTLRIEMLPRRELDHIQAVPRTSRLADLTWTSYLIEDAKGIQEVARQASEGAPVQMIDPPSCVLPFPLKQGNTCTIQQPHRVGDLEFEVTGVRRVEVVDDSVSVPAGNFTNCVRVKTKATGTLRPGHPDAGATLDSEVIEWFAPEMGLVKQIQWAVIDPIRLGWGTRTMELLRHTP